VQICIALGARAENFIVSYTPKSRLVGRKDTVNSTAEMSTSIKNGSSFQHVGLCASC
jgi:hypothetical protein